MFKRIGMVVALLLIIPGFFSSVPSAQERAESNVVVHFDFHGRDIACNKTDGTCTINGVPANMLRPSRIVTSSLMANGAGEPPSGPPPPPVPPQRRVTIIGAIRNEWNGGVFALVIAEKESSRGKLETFALHFTYPGEYMFEIRAVDSKGDMLYRVKVWEIPNPRR